MRIALKDRRSQRVAEPRGTVAAQTLSVAAQMALLCPTGMDIWTQRELTGCSDWERYDSRRAR
jgi:hypothetical protein